MKGMNTLTEFRNNLGLTQLQMAEKLGISLSYYSKLEVGKRNPSFNFITKLKKVFPSIDTEIFFEN